MSRTHCKHGHLLEGENLYLEEIHGSSGSTFRKKCRTCAKQNRRKLTESFHTKEKREPTEEELEDAIKKKISWASLARSCGISDVALRKKARRMGLIQAQRTSDPEKE